MTCEHDKGDKWYRKTNIFNESFCLKMDKFRECPFCKLVKEEDISDNSRIEQFIERLESPMYCGNDDIRKLVKIVKIQQKALSFYADYESDSEGFGGVNGQGLYEIKMGGFSVLDKGKTAQSALRAINKEVSHE